ncbi:MAG: class I SAM-dependent methyltransferase [Acidobacteria bacterium]|nr:class I SAM-dependent methyltransferase [Acidobacteriota bacterium]MCB9397274.1 class I SAM-dependent methyltransferase [Acidobacteriota bacterium]
MRFVLPMLLSTCLLAGDPMLQKVVDGDHRSPENKARDVYRHPAETLAFFGIKPDMTVVEISPGGGWYTEILAPYLREKGTFYAAHAAPDATGYYKRSYDGYQALLATHPEAYDKVKMCIFQPGTKIEMPEGQADMVLTFRNVHNWMPDNAQPAFDAFFKTLKSGGILGVVEHRRPADKAADPDSGYVHVQTVIDLATKAGFKLVDQSEINANPKDTTEHPNGVWTLPPRLATKVKEGDNERELDAEALKAIGESDRMTLKFVKP